MNKAKGSIILLLSAVLVMPLGASYAFDDLLLAMQSGNAELRKGSEEIVQSELDTKNARAGLSPVIDLQVTGTYMANPVMGPMSLTPSEMLSPELAGKLIASGLLSLDDMGKLAPILNEPMSISMKMDPGMVQGQLTLTQPIFTWGKLSTSVKLYERMEEIRRTERSDKERQLEAELRTRLDALYYLDSITDSLSSIEERADRLISIAESAEEAGALLAEDVLEARIQKQQVAVSRREIESSISSVLAALRTLTGIPDLEAGDIICTPDDSMISSVLSIPLDELRAMAVSPSSPALRSLSAAEDAAEAAVQIAKGNMYLLPDLALQIGASYGGAIASDWSMTDSWGLNITFALKANIWDGGKRLNEVRRAESAQREASIEHDSVLSQIDEGVVNAYSSAMLSHDKLGYLSLQRELDEEKLEREKERLRIGSASESSVLTLEIALLESDIAIARERITLSQSAYTLIYLTGSGCMPVISDGMAP